MPVQSKEIIQLITITTCVFLLAPAFLVAYIVIYNKKKNKHLEEKQQMFQAFKNELLQAQLEIQEQTLHNVSEEIHDNIGQVLSFVKLNLATTKGLGEDEKENKINESRELVAQAISDLRDLSKSLSKDNLSHNGFVQTIQTEVDRINKSGLINIQFNVSGDVADLGAQRELVLFRILQESINNVLKHSGAHDLKIGLQYSTDLFTLTLSDNGSGFDANAQENKNGSGLKNIRNRANLIGAEVKIVSELGRGTDTFIKLNPIYNTTYAGGNHPGSIN